VCWVCGLISLEVPPTYEGPYRYSLDVGSVARELLLCTDWCPATRGLLDGRPELLSRYRGTLRELSVVVDRESCGGAEEPWT
jgi:hypothetical protein